MRLRASGTAAPSTYLGPPRRQARHIPLQACAMKCVPAHRDPPPSPVTLPCQPHELDPLHNPTDFLFSKACSSARRPRNHHLGKVDVVSRPPHHDLHPLKPLPVRLLHLSCRLRTESRHHSTNLYCPPVVTHPSHRRARFTLWFTRSNVQISPYRQTRSTPWC